MKKIILMTTFIISINLVYAQTYQMAIRKSDGTYLRIAVNDIEKITVVDCPSTVDDADGNTYSTVVIGNQCWMAENLNVGTKIDVNIYSSDNGVIEKYCIDNDESYCATYGAIYEWDEAMQYGTLEEAQGICPSGWHIPTVAEFQNLITAVGGSGNELKAIGQGTGTNTSGFSALLAGYRLSNDAIFWGEDAYFASSTDPLDPDDPSKYCIVMTLDNNNNAPAIKGFIRNWGTSVRCLKD